MINNFSVASNSQLNKSENVQPVGVDDQQTSGVEFGPGGVKRAWEGSENEERGRELKRRKVSGAVEVAEGGVIESIVLGGHIIPEDILGRIFYYIFEGRHQLALVNKYLNKFVLSYTDREFGKILRHYAPGNYFEPFSRELCDWRVNLEDAVFYYWCACYKSDSSAKKNFKRLFEFYLKDSMNLWAEDGYGFQELVVGENRFFMLNVQAENKKSIVFDDHESPFRFYILCQFAKKYFLINYMIDDEKERRNDLLKFLMRDRIKESFLATVSNDIIFHVYHQCKDFIAGDYDGLVGEACADILYFLIINGCVNDPKQIKGLKELALENLGTSDFALRWLDTLNSFDSGQLNCEEQEQFISAFVSDLDLIDGSHGGGRYWLDVFDDVIPTPFSSDKLKPEHVEYLKNVALEFICKNDHNWTLYEYQVALANLLVKFHLSNMLVLNDEDADKLKAAILLKFSSAENTDVPYVNCSVLLLLFFKIGLSKRLSNDEAEGLMDFCVKSIHGVYAEEVYAGLELHESNFYQDCYWAINQLIEDERLISENMSFELICMIDYDLKEYSKEGHSFFFGHKHKNLLLGWAKKLLSSDSEVIKFDFLKEMFIIEKSFFSKLDAALIASNLLLIIEILCLCRRYKSFELNEAIFESFKGFIIQSMEEAVNRIDIALDIKQKIAKMYFMLAEYRLFEVNTDELGVVKGFLMQIFNNIEIEDSVKSAILTALDSVVESKELVGLGSNEILKSVRDYIIEHF